MVEYSENLRSLLSVSIISVFSYNQRYHFHISRILPDFFSTKLKLIVCRETGLKGDAYKFISLLGRRERLNKQLNWIVSSTGSFVDYRNFACLILAVSMLSSGGGFFRCFRAEPDRLFYLLFFEYFFWTDGNRGKKE